MEKTQIYEWHKRFCVDHVSFNNDPCCGFFDAQGLVRYQFIPEGCTVNKEMYIEILRRLRNAEMKEPSRKKGMKQLVSSA
jgi:hypothetical protein